MIKAMRFEGLKREGARLLTCTHEKSIFKLNK
jgi:hypothetical protein